MKMKFTITRRSLVLLLVVLLLATALRILWYHVAIHVDEGEYGYTAMMWSRGYPPYSYRRDMQPPMVYLFYILFSLDGVRILNDVFFLISVVVMFFLAKEVSGGLLGAFIGSAFYGIFMSVPALEGIFALPASLAVPSILISLYSGLIYWRNGQRAFLLLAGILVSIAGLTYAREASFVFILIFIIVSRALRLKQGVTNVAKEIGFLAAGMLLPLLAFVFYFAYYGLAGALVSGVLRPIYSQRVVQAFPFGWVILTLLESLPLFIFSIGGFVVAVFRHSKYDVLLVFMFVLSYALDSFSFFGHYLLNIVIPSALLSAVFIPILARTIGQASRSGKARRIPKLFVISVLLLSFSISGYFQILRYPNGSIQIDSLFWAISPLGSYQNQTMLATFLRNHTNQSEQVLVHGWMPEIYYLSGIQAPNPDLDTYDVGVTIPLKEYQTLLNLTIQQKFKYVVLADWAGWDRDAIAIAARVYYREIDRIGRVELFERQALYQSIKDSSFENMSNWVITDPAYATYTTAHAHSGNRSIAIIQSGHLLSNLVYQDIPAKGNTQYTLSAWGLNCFRNDIWFSIDEIDANGEPLRHTNIGTDFISLNEWSQTAYKFTTLNRTTQIRIYINILDLGTNYTAYFDAVNLLTPQA
jgi:hypothetical protein